MIKRFCSIMALRKVLFFFSLFLLSVEGNASHSEFDSLSDNYKILGAPIKGHIVQTVKEWNDLVDNDEGGPTTNKLKVGLYAYDKDEKKWFFYSDPLRYMSKWKIDNKSKNDKTIGCMYFTNDKDVINAAAIDDNKNKSVKKKINQDFLDRGLEKGFSSWQALQKYGHSEQAWISMLQNAKDNGELTKYHYSHYFLLLVSTNEPCDSCGNTISYLFSNKIFEDTLLKRLNVFNRIEVNTQQDEDDNKEDNDKKPHFAPLNFAVNLLYESARPYKKTYLETLKNHSALNLHAGRLNNGYFERKMQVQIAQNMLKQNQDLKNITDATGLSKEEVQKIQKDTK